MDGLPSYGHISVDGARLRYEVAGRGLPTAMLHGGPGLGYDYLRREVTALLSDTHHLIFYDQRGSGRSSGRESPSLLTMATFVADLDAVRAAAGPDRLHLVGHSFGGLLGMHYAIAHPERVASLVLVESDPASREQWIAYRNIVDSRRRPDDRAALTALESSPGWGVEPALTERYLRIYWKTYFSSGQVPDDLDLHFDENLQANFAVTPGAIRKDLGSWDLYERLDRIRCPALVIYGRDSIFPSEAGERMCAHIRDATLDVLDNVGHFPMLEDPAAFVSSIRRFRARHPR